VPAEVSYNVAFSGTFTQEDEDGPIVNHTTPEAEPPAAAEMQAEVPIAQPTSPARPTEASRVDEGTEARETGGSRVCDEFGTEAFRFDDPYWDDAFDSYHNPTLRVCCKR
jgi:hypothetical protein